MQPLYAAPPASASQDAAHSAIAALLPAPVVMTLTELFGTDLQQWRFIVDLFCDTADKDLASLDNAIARGIDSNIVEAAHRIVGAARMLGHAPIGDAARAVERIAQSIGPFHERTAEMQRAFLGLRAQVGEFRLRASRCAWHGSAG